MVPIRKSRALSMYCIYPLRRDENQWTRHECRVLFTWSIINPNGPTLNCVGVRRCPDSTQIQVFYRWFHFLGGRQFVLGFIDADSEHLESALMAVLRPIFVGTAIGPWREYPLVTCVPSFVTPPPADDLIKPEQVLELISSSAAFQSADWGRERYYLGKYQTDFFSRAAEETREAVEQSLLDPDLSPEQQEYFETTKVIRSHLPGFRDWKPNQYTPRRFTAADSQHWWNTVTDPQFELTAAGQLAWAWVGSIHQANGAHPVVESFEFVRDFMTRHGYPLWPETYSTQSLREAMGVNG